MKKPKCPCCGGGIPKATKNVYAPREKNRGVPESGWRYTGNLIVVSRRYCPITKDKRLDYVSVWDGETYAPRFGYFCTINCAAAYGRNAYAGVYR